MYFNVLEEHMAEKSPYQIRIMCHKQGTGPLSKTFPFSMHYFSSGNKQPFSFYRPVARLFYGEVPPNEEMEITL